MDKTIRLDYTFKPILFKQINSEFSLMRCYIMALGKNRNYSNFDKEHVEKALPSIFNIPVVAHLKKRDDGWYVGSHDRQIIIDDEGITVNELTVPYGCVPESCNPEWVEVTEQDGTKAEYLVATIILWTGRYPNLLDAKSATDPDVYYNQSMEINVLGWKQLESDKKYTDITDFEFSALCLLGRDLENPEYHTEPCFPSARVEPFEFSLGNEFKQEFASMLNELNKIDFSQWLKEELTSFNNKPSPKEEEGEVLDEKLELIAKYNLTVEQLDFDINEISLEDLDIKLKEFTENDKHEDPKDKPQSFSATHNQIREALRNALDSTVVRNDDGDIIEEISYWVADVSDEYVYVERYHWKADGDFERNYGRFTYTFDEETITATITGEFEEMFLVWLTREEKDEIDAKDKNYEQIKSEFDEYKASHPTPETEVDELRKFQSERLKADRDEAEKEIFDKFDEKLKDNEEYLALKEKSNEYDLEALQKECFAILGRTLANFSMNTPKKKEPIKVPFEREMKNEDPYGGIHKKYLHNN